MCYVLKVTRGGARNPSILIFPLGHPVELVSANRAVSETAASLWPWRSARFDVEPLRVAVETRTTSHAPHPVTFAPHAAGFVVDAGPAALGEFVIASRSATLSASPAALAPMLELLLLTALDWTFFIGVHAACVMRDGRSVLLLGDSHAGKSTLAYACARAGWTFVSDNALHWAAAPWDELVSGSARLRLRDGARAMFSVAENDVNPSQHGMLSATTAPSGPCVFLHRRPGPALCVPRSVQDAMAYLAQYDTRPDRTYAEDRYRELLRHGVHMLEYENAEDAVRCLEMLL